MSSPNFPATEENTSNDDESKRNALRSEVEALHAEMEIAGYGLNEHTGRSKRKVSRKEMKRRTIKRKTLEKEDVKNLAVHRTENSTKRLRGSKAAFEEEVIRGSLIFGGDKDDNPSTGANEENEEGEESDGENYAEDDIEDFDDEEGRYELYKYEFDELEPANEVEDDEDDNDNASGEENVTTGESSSKKRKSGGKNATTPDPAHAKKIDSARSKFPNKKIARTMYRLRNFNSHRMAEKHGDALGRHARGMNRSAVSKLKEVASAAPIAPQVYSSLGLVYESMLSDEMRNIEKMRGQEQQEKRLKGLGECSMEIDCDVNEASDTDVFTKEAKDVNSCIELAEKTFGSYHVAALLCKLDYTLWLRAGDAAMKIADLHMKCLSLPPILDPEDSVINDSTNSTVENPNDGESKKEKKKISTPEEYMLYHKEQKIRWLEEAKNDYLTADNIKPPGITVPSKLAHAHMQLGNLSEAITILTDLKNSALKYQNEESENNEAKPRSELEKSYGVWLLYADLMLTIGYECSKWNRGEQTNENYMFRRWLRKYSTTFDWRERRLHSLCLALESAAGTKCCRKIVSWMHERAAGRHHNNDTYDIDQQTKKAKLDPKLSEEKDTSSNAVLPLPEKDGQRSSLCGKGSVDELFKAFNVERENLVSRHHQEVDEFDKATAEMNLLHGSEEEVKRRGEREKMISRHKFALINLAEEYQKNKRAIEETMNTKDKGQQELLQPLQISASCASVCDIASQLMKLCIGIDLYSLCELTAEAVSLYFKERAARCHERAREMMAFDKRQISASANILQLSKEVYDDLHSEPTKAFNDEDSILYLSDEEDFNAKGSEEIIEMMEKGNLPPELQVIYGVCLMGKGGNDFLAEKLLHAISALDDECMERIQFMLDCGTTDDISLEIFRQTMSDTLSKPAAFAFLSDFTIKMNKEEKWASRLLPLFAAYLNEIKNCEEVNRLLQIEPSAISLYMLTKRNYYVTTLLATLRMQTLKAQELMSQNAKVKDAYALANSIIDTVYNYRKTLLRDTDGTELSKYSIETLKILCRSFRIATELLDRSDDELDLVDVLSKLRTIVCWICRTIIPNHDDAYPTTSNTSLEKWRHFPISSEWQTEELKMLSKRAFNLCVGCNVSTFSGWEESEFDLRFLRRHEGPSFFGINIRGMQVAGYLNHDNETQLSQQWKILGKLLPMLATLDFDDATKKAKKTEWYNTAQSNLETDFHGIPISTFAEEEALSIILMFSRLCLKLANLEKDEWKQQCLIKNAMSIVLPMSQYSLDQPLWDSTIGANVKRRHAISEWEHFDQEDSKATTGRKTPRQKKKTLKKKSSSASGEHSKKNVDDIKKNDPSSALAKLVKVPVDTLMMEWNGREDFEDDEDEDILDRRLNKWSQTVSGPAKLAMKRVDFTVRKLRQSSTINSLQKSSLQVASALLEVVSTKECQNPFLCLHQAAVFASQGSKGGNNDEEFKKPLPEESFCTPLEALNIIGRSDCLRAIHFIDEAIFLCSYVAKVCRLHRDKKSEYPWTPKWRAVGILMYTVSIAIDATTSSFMTGDARNSALSSWGNDVKAEISRARSDAIALQKAFPQSGFPQSKGNTNAVTTSIATTHSDGESYHVSDEAESIGEDEDYESDRSDDKNDSDIESTRGDDYHNTDYHINDKVSFVEENESTIEDNALGMEPPSLGSPKSLNGAIEIPDVGSVGGSDSEDFHISVIPV